MVAVMVPGELRVALICGVLVYCNKSSSAAAVRAGRLDPRRAVRDLDAPSSVVRAAFDLACVRWCERAEHVDQQCLFLARWLLSAPDVRVLLDHRERTAVCLLATVDPFPPRDWSLATTLSAVTDACSFVPTDESFSVWLETFLVLAEDWTGSLCDLAATASALGCR